MSYSACPLLIVFQKRIDKYFDGVSDRLAAVDAKKIAQFVTFSSLTDAASHSSFVEAPSTDTVEAPSTNTRALQATKGGATPGASSAPSSSPGKSSAPLQQEDSMDKAGFERRKIGTDKGNGDHPVPSNLVPRLLKQVRCSNVN